MRFKLIQSRHSLVLRYVMHETHMQGKIELEVPPIKEMDAVRKVDVDESSKNLDPGLITGTFDKSQFPEYLGDFIKNQDHDYILKNNKLGGKTYLVVGANEKGLVNSTSNDIIPDMWGSVKYERIDRNTLPPDLGSLGITNVIPLDGTGYTTTGFHYQGDMELAERPIVYGDVSGDLSHLNQFKPGDVIMLPRDVATTINGFYKANRALIPKKGNEELYNVVGDDYGRDYGKYGSGQPWRNLNNISDVTLPATPTFGNIAGREPGVNIGGSAMFITNSRIFTFGGHRGNRREIMNVGYTSTIDSGGNITKWNKIAGLPEPRTDARAVAFAGYVYIVGGSKSIPDGNVPINVLRSKVAADGTLGAWEVMGVTLPRSLCNPAVFVFKRRLYVMGGKMHTGKFLPDASFGEWPEYQINTFVYYANINVDGTLGEFKIASEGPRSQEGSIVSSREDVAMISSWNDNKIESYSTTPSNSFSLGTWKKVTNDVNYVTYTIATIGTTRQVAMFIDSGTMDTGSGIVPYGYMYAQATNSGSNGITAIGAPRLAYSDDYNRVYFDVVATSSKIYAIGGLTSTGTYNIPDPGNEVIRDLVMNYTGGKNNYLPYFDNSKITEDVPSDKFALPDLPDEKYRIGGKDVWYSFFIKK